MYKIGIRRHAIHISQGSENKVAQLVGGSEGKESACNAGNTDSIPGSGRSLGEGNGYPLLYSCMENSMDRGAWQATVHGVTKSQTQLSNTEYTAAAAAAAAAKSLQSCPTV